MPSSDPSTMPRRTIFLSKLIGLHCSVIAAAMIANKQAYIENVNAIVRNPPLLLLSCIIALLLGLAVVLAHNVWSGGAAPVIVTLIGWISLVKGLIFLFLSSERALQYFYALHYEQFFYVFAGFTLLTGVFLTYSGFKARKGPVAALDTSK